MEILTLEHCTQLCIANKNCLSGGFQNHFEDLKLCCLSIVKLISSQIRLNSTLFIMRNRCLKKNNINHSDVKIIQHIEG